MAKYLRKHLKGAEIFSLVVLQVLVHGHKAPLLLPCDKIETSWQKSSAGESWPSQGSQDSEDGKGAGTRYIL
jgi:hypothetical protein